MVQFTLKKDDRDKLLALSEVYAVEKDRLSLIALMTVNSDTLTISIPGNGTAADLRVGISDVKFDDPTSTEVLNPVEFEKFINALVRLGQEDVIIKCEPDLKRCTIRQPSTSTFISVKRNIAAKEETLKEDSAFIDNIINGDRFKNPFNLNYTAELCNFIKTTSKYMQLTNGSNCIQIDGNTLRYGDRLAFIGREVNEPVIDSQKPFLLPYNIMSLLQKLNKFITAATPKILFSNDSRFCYIEMPSFGVRVLLEPGRSNFSYPNKYEISNVTADENYAYKMKISKEAFISAVDRFRCVFKGSDWNYEPVYIEIDPNSENNTVRVHWEDMTADVDTVVPVIGKVEATNHKEVYNKNLVYVRPQDGFKQGHTYYEFDDDKNLVATKDIHPDQTKEYYEWVWEAYYQFEEGRNYFYKEGDNFVKADIKGFAGEKAIYVEEALNTISYIAATAVVIDYLNMSADDEIEVTVPPSGTTYIHGDGVTYKLGNITIVGAKVRPSNVGV